MKKLVIAGIVAGVAIACAIVRKRKATKHQEGEAQPEPTSETQEASDEKEG